MRKEKGEERLTRTLLWHVIDVMVNSNAMLMKQLSNENSGNATTVSADALVVEEDRL